MLFSDLEIVQAAKQRKKASNTGKGITEPQREALKNISSARGAWFEEIERNSGRIMFRCYNHRKIIIGPDTHKIVLMNLVKKGYLYRNGKKYFLK